MESGRIHQQQLTFIMKSFSNSLPNPLHPASSPWLSSRCYHIVNLCVHSIALLNLAWINFVFHLLTVLLSWLRPCQPSLPLKPAHNPSACHNLFGPKPATKNRPERPTPDLAPLCSIFLRFPHNKITFTDFLHLSSVEWSPLMLRSHNTGLLTALHSLPGQKHVSPCSQFLCSFISWFLL